MIDNSPNSKNPMRLEKYVRNSKKPKELSPIMPLFHNILMCVSVGVFITKQLKKADQNTATEKYSANVLEL